MRNRNIERAVKFALLAAGSASLGMQAMTAVAQDQEVEQVVVTGSRIRMPNLEGTSPVTQVTSADIATQGVTRVEDLVNQLPQAFAAQNATVSNGSTGTATVNLRGLGEAAHSRADRWPAHALRRRHQFCRGPEPDSRPRWSSASRC